MWVLLMIGLQVPYVSIWIPGGAHVGCNTWVLMGLHVPYGWSSILCYIRGAYWADTNIGIAFQAFCSVLLDFAFCDIYTFAMRQQ